jgi:hypothetical protein
MGLFTKAMKQAEKEMTLDEREKAIFEKEADLYQRKTVLDANFGISEKVRYSATELVKKLGEIEHEYHSAVSDNAVRIAEKSEEAKNNHYKSMAEIDIKKVEKEAEVNLLTLKTDSIKTLNKELESVSSVKLDAMKEKYDAILKMKDEMVELLKTQVEILTAKLTEIKISDAHIHVETTGNKEK